MRHLVLVPASTSPHLEHRSYREFNELLTSRYLEISDTFSSRVVSSQMNLLTNAAVKPRRECKCTHTLYCEYYWILINL